MNKAPRPVPASVVHRLTKYLACVQSLCERSIEWVSSAELAETLGLTPSTVRQDLTHVDFSGISKRGYETKGLRRVLTHVFGADRQWKVVVVGAGNLGRALALHEDFARRGFHVCGIFDADAKKVGRKFGQLAVRNMEDLPRIVSGNQIEIGVIAVPSAASQRVADLLIASGIRGLLNLSASHIIAPRRVAVVDSRIIACLQELAHQIGIRRGD